MAINHLLTGMIVPPSSVVLLFNWVKKMVRVLQNTILHAQRNLRFLFKGCITDEDSNYPERNRLFQRHSPPLSQRASEDSLIFCTVETGKAIRQEMPFLVGKSRFNS